MTVRFSAEQLEGLDFARGEVSLGRYVKAAALERAAGVLEPRRVVLDGGVDPAALAGGSYEIHAPGGSSGAVPAGELPGGVRRLPRVAPSPSLRRFGQ